MFGIQKETRQSIQLILRSKKTPRIHISLLTSLEAQQKPKEDFVPNKSITVASSLTVLHFLTALLSIYYRVEEMSVLISNYCK